MNEYNDQNYSQPAGGDTENVYKSADPGKAQSRAWSVTALFFGILSILFCLNPWVGGICSALAMVSAIVSRKNLGYFDGFSVSGLITAIFGMVFVIAIAVVGALFAEEIALWVEHILAEL